MRSPFPVIMENGKSYLRFGGSGNLFFVACFLDRWLGLLMILVWVVIWVSFVFDLYLWSGFRLCLISICDLGLCLCLISVSFSFSFFIYVVVIWVSFVFDLYWWSGSVFVFNLCFFFFFFSFVLLWSGSVFVFDLHFFFSFLFCLCYWLLGLSSSFWIWLGRMRRTSCKSYEN